MTYDQLKAINRMLALPTIGSKTYLRFQLNMKLRQLRADDVVRLKALSHGAIFLATCNAILLLGDVKLAKTCFHHSLLKYS